MKMFQWLAAACVFGAGPAVACSMDPEWVKPSNFELVEQSDAVFVATPLEMVGDQLQFRVDKVFSGQVPRTYRLKRSLGATVASDQEDFSRAHPDATSGSCSRWTFTKGRPVLLIASRHDGALYPSSAFSRDSEDYGGPTSPWTRTVLRYLDLVKSLSPMERYKALEVMARSGKDREGNTLTANELEDIREHLSSLSPYKPTAILLKAYAAIEHGQMPESGIRSRDADREGGLADELTREVFGDPLKPSDGSREGSMDFVLTSLVTGKHPDARGLFRSLNARRDLSPNRRGLVLRYLAENGDLDLAADYMLTSLEQDAAMASDVGRAELFQSVSRAMHVEGSDEPRWKANARLKAEWPTKALALSKAEFRRSGNAYLPAPSPRSRLPIFAPTPN